MNTVTKQLFNAPWHISGDGCQIDDNNGNEVTHTNDDVKTAYRLARLPELYDALLDAVWNKCYRCRGERPLATEAILKHGCPYNKKDRQCLQWIALLNKIREGQ